MRASSDLSGAYELASEALRLAAGTPEADDDIQAMERLLALTQEERDIVECATRLAQLTGQGNGTPSLAQLFGSVRTAALMKGVELQILPLLVEAGEKLLGATLDWDVWMPIAAASAAFHALSKRHAQAKAIVMQVRRRASSDKERQDADLLEAKIKAYSGDREGACATVESIFQQLAPEDRFWPALVLVQMWPPGRPGRERFVDLVCEAWTGGLCSATTWPTAAWLVLFSLQQTVQEWGDEPAAALLEHFNIERAEATMSDAQRRPSKRA